MIKYKNCQNCNAPTGDSKDGVCRYCKASIIDEKLKIKSESSKQFWKVFKWTTFAFFLIYIIIAVSFLFGRNKIADGLNNNVVNINNNINTTYEEESTEMLETYNENVEQSQQDFDDKVNQMNEEYEESVNSLPSL